MTPIAHQTAKLAATIYRGVFEREYQAAVEIDGKQIVVTVSDDFVEFASVPTDEGVAGFLKVDIVDREDDSFTLALPGEVQGGTSRVSARRSILHSVLR